LTAVSNSSPLILFSRIGRLDLVQTLFDEVLVPPAVWDEVVTLAPGRAGERDVRQANWIRVHPLPGTAIANQFAALDPGEAEALTLVASFGVETPILLDDLQARRAAHASGLYVIGSGGILGRAEEAALITSVRPLLFELRAAGLFLSNRAVDELLDTAGEKS
jgi:uncharacterized protein